MPGFIKDIYFFDYRALGVLLKQDKVDDFQALKHLFLAVAVFSSQVLVPSLNLCGTTDGYGAPIVFLEWVGMVFIHFWGFMNIYRAKTDDNLPLFKSIACLYLPASIYFLLGTIIVTFVVMPILINIVVPEDFIPHLGEYLWWVYGPIYNSAFYFCLLIL